MPDGNERSPKDEWCYLDAPSLARLDHAILIINRAFEDSLGTYLVGSCLQHADYRDVDVRVIMPDEEYDRLFPGRHRPERTHALWSLMCLTITQYLTVITGLPIDFQIQRQSDANKKFDGPCAPLGIYPLSERHEL